MLCLLVLKKVNQEKSIRMKSSLEVDERRVQIGIIAQVVGYLFSVLFCEGFLLLSICLHYDRGWLTYATPLVIVFFILSVYLGSSLFQKLKKKPENMFLVFFTPLVFAYCLFIIPTNTPDEPAHIMRLFDNRAGIRNLQIPEQINIGQIWYYGDLMRFLREPFDYSQLVTIDWAAAQNYSEINYLLPSVAVTIGVGLGINGWILVYAASVINSFLFIFAAYYSLRILPFGKTVALVLLLNPIMLQQVTSTSADSLCFISAICFVSLLIKMRFSGNSPRKVEWLLLLGFALLLALCKYVYLPLLALAVILLPKISRRTRYVLFGVSLLLIFAIVLYFLLVRDIFGSDTSIAITLLRITESVFHPDFFSLLGSTIFGESHILLWQFAGGNLGWPSLWGNPGQFEIPILWIVYLMVLTTAVMHDGAREVRFKTWERIFTISICILGSFLIFLVMASTLYKSDTKEFADSTVSIMQGRYFIPLIYPAMFALIPGRQNALSKIPSWIFIAFLWLISIGNIVFIINQLWVINFF